MNHNVLKSFAIICFAMLFLLDMAGCEEWEKKPVTQEEYAARAASQYLDALAAGDEEALLDMMNSTWAGSCHPTSEDIIMPLEEAEKQSPLMGGRTEEEVRDFMLKCFDDQRIFLRECFGGDVWDSVAFTLEEVASVNGVGELTTGIFEYDLYKVNLTFDGKVVSDKGYEAFRFYVSNKDGKWGIQEGLAWDSVLPEYQETEI